MNFNTFENIFFAKNHDKKSKEKSRQNTQTCPKRGTPFRTRCPHFPPWGRPWNEPWRRKQLFGAWDPPKTQKWSLLEQFVSQHERKIAYIMMGNY